MDHVNMREMLGVYGTSIHPGETILYCRVVVLIILINT